MFDCCCCCPCCCYGCCKRCCNLLLLLFLFIFFLYLFIPNDSSEEGGLCVLCVCVWELFTELELLRPWATRAVHWPWEVRHVRRSVDGKCYKNFNSYRCNLNIKVK